jgi:hypothetical protein
MAESTPNHHSSSFTFDNVDEFTLKEILDNQGYLLLDIRGTITLTSSPSTQTAAVVANISMTTHNIEIEATHFDRRPTSLTIGNPELKNRSYFRRPYITLDITLSINPSLNLSTLTVSTRHLHIEIDPSLSLSVSSTTTLTTISGRISSPTAPQKFTSRSTYLTTTSGPIQGSYSLNDILSCTTTSGSIRIAVLAQEPGKIIRPAAFTATTASGHCDVQFQTLDAPDRDYTVDVRTGSGGLSGTYIHGSSTRIASGSGSKRVTVVPYNGSRKPSELVTEGVSGSSEVTVLPPILRSSKTLGALRSTHRSVSGSLRLNYPREWAGVFEGKSVSGSLIVEGSGLVVNPGDGGPGHKRVSGRSEVMGEAELGFSSVSGSARLVVG